MPWKYSTQTHNPSVDRGSGVHPMGTEAVTSTVSPQESILAVSKCWLRFSGLTAPVSDPWILIPLRASPPDLRVMIFFPSPTVFSWNDLRYSLWMNTTVNDPMAHFWCWFFFDLDPILLSTMMTSDYILLVQPQIASLPVPVQHRKEKF